MQQLPVVQAPPPPRLTQAPLDLSAPPALLGMPAEQPPPLPQPQQLQPQPFQLQQPPQQQIPSPVVYPTGPPVAIAAADAAFVPTPASTAPNTARGEPLGAVSPEMLSRIEASWAARNAQVSLWGPRLDLLR
mmetsp:Transcript_23493/g.51055  ORF Transcript_23493/g.51055 Transcript_23493/m.51055 type:complete len:132 (-) Transcript_23493:72-467(-)